MPTDFTRRVLVCVPAARRNAANVGFGNLTGRGPDGESFAIPLSANGQLPATHFAANMSVKERVFERVRDEMRPVLAGFWMEEYDLIAEPGGARRIFAEHGVQMIRIPPG